MFLPENCFIICCMDSYCFKRRLTSTTCTPEPAATRFLRLELSSAGFSRSAGVIERMIASCRAISRSSNFAPLSAPAFIPGIIAAMLSRSPMFFS